MGAKDYSQLEKEELIKIIERLESRKRYGLIWDEEKTKEQFEKDAQNALPVLKEVKSKEIQDNKPDSRTNIIIEGDNYHALSVLNFTHQGMVDVIYIDPPYNTGARDWKYNNDYVEESDSFRHSKWISFMYKRLVLAKAVLADDGVICVTIDDYEVSRLLMIMEEIFGEDNHLGTVVIRNNPKGRMTNRHISLTHEYAIFFGKSELSKIKRVPVAPEDKTHNYKQDTDGSWYLDVNLRKQGIDSTAVNAKGKLSERYYPIYFDSGSGKVSTSEKYSVEIFPVDPRGEKRIWRRSKDAINEMYEKGDLWVKKVKGKYQIYYKFRGGLDGQMPKSIWSDSKFSASEYGTQILASIMGSRETFQYPKSPYAVIECIKAASDKKDAIILDFFAGSGTTAHAVLELNKSDTGNRQFILCTNNEGKIATHVCYPRVQRIMKGYKNHGDKIQGIGGKLKYYKTAFVKESISKDDMKIRLTKECTELLCLREGVFNEVISNFHYRVYALEDKVLAIYFSLQRDFLNELKSRLSKIGGQKILYCFTLDPLGLNKTDFDDWGDVILEPIPQKILDVYKQIYEY